jgi:hypothetical protein
MTRLYRDIGLVLLTITVQDFPQPETSERPQFFLFGRFAQLPFYVVALGQRPHESAVSNPASASHPVRFMIHVQARKARV